MPKRFPKHKLLLDEHLLHRRYYPVLNEHFDVKHVAMDLKGASLEDPDVYDLAVQTGRILITRNDNDFRPLVGTKQDAGVIAIPPHTPAAQVDTALAALLMRHGPRYFAGQLRNLSREQLLH
jgi:predicted nuclease of predicted toxin-antitoxin system